VGLGFYVQILGLAHESFWNVVAATARAVGHLQKSADVMKLVNGLMKTPEMAVTMQEFSKEMLKVQLFIFMCVSLCSWFILGLGLQLKFGVSGVGFSWLMKSWISLSLSVHKK